MRPLATGGAVLALVLLAHLSVATERASPAAPAVEPETVETRTGEDHRVQVLRLLENFPLEVVHAAIAEALSLEVLRSGFG